MTTSTLPREAESRSGSAAEPEKRRRRPRHLSSRIGYYVVLAAIAAVYLVPLLYLFSTAMKSPVDYLRDPVGLAPSFTFDNFRDAWEEGGFRDFVANSVVYTIIGATAGTILSLFVAFPIARGYVRWSKFWTTVMVAALFLPNAITAQFQLMLGLNLYDTRVGYVLLLVGTVGVGPLLMITYFRTLPQELDEAAAMDGCGYFRYVFTFVIPLTLPVQITVFTLQAIGIWNDIILATIYLTDPADQPVTRGLFSFYGQYGNESTLLAAATFMVAAPLIIMYLFFQKYIAAGAVDGALKG